MALLDDIKILIQRVAPKLEALTNNKRFVSDAENQIAREGHMQQVILNRWRVAAASIPGSPWAPLARSTVMQKIHRGYPTNILVRTGALRAAAQNAVRDSYHIYGTNFTNKLSDISVPYANYHQRGGTRLPARPFLNDPTPEELHVANVRMRQILSDIISRIIR